MIFLTASEERKMKYYIIYIKSFFPDWNKILYPLLILVFFIFFGLDQVLYDATPAKGIVIESSYKSTITGNVKYLTFINIENQKIGSVKLYSDEKYEAGDPIELLKKESIILRRVNYDLILMPD